MRIRNDYVFGTTTAPLTAGDTSMASTGLGRLADVASPDIAAIVLHDPAVPAYEVVHVVSHVYGQATATLLRAQEGTTARAWPAGTQWMHGVTTADLTTELDARYAPHGAILRPNLHIGEDEPEFSQPGLWVQLGLGKNGKGMTIWIEDGT